MLQQIETVFQEHAAKLAFWIGKQKYSYADFLLRINGIRQLIRDHAIESEFVGVAGYDDLETYASILALWSEGYAFLPISPLSPPARNEAMLQQADVKFVLNSREDYSLLPSKTNGTWLLTKGLQAEGEAPDVSKFQQEDILCMIFTSGSTGKPKGVPYTLRNINSTLDAFFAFDYELGPVDRFLQMFELTFDMSLLSYLPAWCIGASVHTVAQKGIKYLNAIRVMQSQDISFAAMVPSTLELLRPYFNEIALPTLRYHLLGGEPFYMDLARDWLPCVPNARVVNISGPCETTMACMGYELDRDFEKNRSHKGILAFGTPWKNTKVLLLDEQGEPVKPGEEGELCFGGDHVMKGYWQMPEKNRQVIFEKDENGIPIRFYRSGDMAFQDASGIYYSCGRKDHQYKIQGFKVELGDIEQHINSFLDNGKGAAYVHQNEKGLLEIHVFVDQEDANLDALHQYLRSQLPSYMQPKSLRILNQLPRTHSNKLDRGKLKKIFAGDDFDFVKDDELVARIADNLHSFYREIARIMELPVWKSENLEAVHLKGAAWPRMIFGRLTKRQLPQVVSDIQKEELPSRMILLRSQHRDVYNEISDAGFRHMMAWPAMAINLEGRDVEQSTPTCRLIEYREELASALIIINEVLFSSQGFSEVVLKKLWQTPACKFYGSFDQGQLCSVAMTFTKHGACGIYFVGTAKKYQRKGHAKKLMLHILQSAKEQGLYQAYLQSSRDALKMYQDIGFKTFTNFDIFWHLGQR